MMPTIVISNPLAHQLRVVTILFAAPTAKCARMLIASDAMTALAREEFLIEIEAIAVVG